MKRTPKTMPKKATSKKTSRGDRATETPGQPCHATQAGPDTGERMAVAVDADAVERNLKRLRRIEGQVRGLQKMVADGRYCADILVQVSAVNQALRGVAKELLRNHLKHCAAAALAKGGAEAEAMHGELLDLVFQHAD